MVKRPTQADWNKALRVMRQIYRVYDRVDISRGRGDKIKRSISEAGQAVKLAGQQQKGD